jgi:tetratricopeptide (TPR) repeat protein
VLVCLVACATPPRPRTTHRDVPVAPTAFDRESILGQARGAATLDAAEAQYRALLAHDPDDPIVEEFVRFQIDRGLAGDAVELARASYARHHDPAHMRLYLDALFAAGDAEHVTAIAEELADPAYSARALLAIGQRVEAVTRLKELANAQPDDAKLHLWLAEALLRQAEDVRFSDRDGVRGQAIEQAGLALQRNTTLVRAYLVLADALQFNFDYEHTRLVIETLLTGSRNVRSAALWVRMVQVPSSQADKIAAMRHALDIEPNRGEYWTQLAHLLREEQPERAREAYAKAVSVTRPDFEAAEPLGPMLVVANKLGEARSLAADIAKRAPASSVPHLILGALAVREHKPDVALAELDQYLAASTNWRDEVEHASTCVRELVRDDPRECPWFDADYLKARRACGSGPKLATVRRKPVRVKRSASVAERNSVAESASKRVRVTEGGVLIRPSGEHIKLTTTRVTHGDDAKLELLFGTERTTYTLTGGHAWARAGVCRARELPSSEREVVEDMAWRVPELLANRIRDTSNRVDLVDDDRFLLTAPSGAAVTFHVSGGDIDELVYRDAAGTFSEKLDDWRVTNGVRVPYHRRISIYGNEALDLSVESVELEPDDAATLAP